MARRKAPEPVADEHVEIAEDAPADIITRAGALQADINTRIDASLKASRELAKQEREIEAMQSEMSLIEMEWADSGSAVADLHKAISNVDG